MRDGSEYLFTGIVEEIGEIVSITSRNQAKDVIIKAPSIFDSVILGQSICVNGVCLTISKIVSKGIEVQAGFETLRTTNLNEIAIGMEVHLERAMQVGSRFDGHIVQGHIDGTCKLLRKLKRGENLEFSVKFPPELGIYLIDKGSVALDGVSLTLVSVDKENSVFSVGLIPHTLKTSLFSEYSEGKILNIELDLIGKYIHNVITELFYEDSKKEKINSITKDFLVKHGYL